MVAAALWFAVPRVRCRPFPGYRKKPRTPRAPLLRPSAAVKPLSRPLSSPRRTGCLGLARTLTMAVRQLEEFVAPAPASTMVWKPILGDSIFRFDVTEVTRKEAGHSLSFEDPAARETFLDVHSLANKTPSYVPVWSYDSNGQQTVDLELPAGTSFYGTGEVGGSLERSGKRAVMWNTDAWGYAAGTSSLYQSHPWVFAVFPGGEVFGALADTSLKCEVDLRKAAVIRFRGPNSYPVVTFGPYSKPEMLCKALSLAIGTAAMPPKWTLGYHQCRWSYETAQRVEEVAKTFREKKIPCDVIWMDIDYMQGFRCFTFDQDRFSDPRKLSQTLQSEGFHGVWMLDPGIKQEAGYAAYDSGSAEDVWVLGPEGKTYVGNCWPGPCVFPDYTRSQTRSWWAQNVKEFCGNGIDGIWNDMNEPAVFNTVSKTMPTSNVHRGDAELGGCQSHSYYHNAYGSLMARSTYEGMMLANPDKRPFVLTRAAMIGSQRYAATWTGDNFSTWDHLRMSIPMSLNLGLSGQPFSGPDIGGFAGDATPRMFARWIGIGSLLPFSRGHSEKGTIDQEPWSFGKECEDISRLALERRYRLLPHLYTLMYNAHKTGVPAMTPLFWADPKDPQLRGVDNAFLLGPLLVSTNVELTRKFEPESVVLPNGIWRWFDFEDQHADLPLLHLRGGGILPTGAVIQSVGEAKETDAVVLLVALDENGAAEGTLYEDAGDGHAYKEGDFLLTHYHAQYAKQENGLASHEVVVRVSQSEGTRERPDRPLIVRLLVADGVFVDARGVDGKEVLVQIPSSEDIARLQESVKGRLQALVDEEAVHDEGADHELVEEAEAEAHKKAVVDITGGDWALKLVPGIGGRISSMVHVPTGHEWLWSRIEFGGYEEYTGTEYRSAGCSEFYHVVDKDLPGTEAGAALCMEGDIGGGLALTRRIGLAEGASSVASPADSSIQICSRIVAKSVGAGSGGFSRLVCLRVHPTFNLLDPISSFVKFTAIDGTVHEIKPDSGDTTLQGSSRPNGEWLLIDNESGVTIVNRFQVDEVATCFIHWGPGTCNLELWSEERPVSAETPIQISHEYRLLNIYEESMSLPPEPLLRFELPSAIDVYA